MNSETKNVAVCYGQRVIVKFTKKQHGNDIDVKSMEITADFNIENIENIENIAIQNHRNYRHSS